MRKLIFLLTFTLLLFHSTILVFADTCSSLPPSQAQVDCYQKVVDSLSSQVNTLAGQVSFYDAQIKLVMSKINQTEDQIASISVKINSLEDKLQEKSLLLEKQIRLSYKQGQLDPLQIFFSSDDVSQLISRFKYLQIVQSTNRRFLAETQAVQNNYGQQKTLIQDSQKRLQSQKITLASIRTQRDALLSQTKNDEANYQRQLARAKAELAAMQSFTAGSSVLNNQTVCNDWGCYYNQRDSKWAAIAINGQSNCSDSSGHNISCSMLSFGCLISSVSMVASHYKKSFTPDNLALSFGSNFQVGTALLSYNVNVNGINVARTSYGRNLNIIDSELSAGRPVIVGLYTGPAHFIVLKSGSNGNYIMNDPFMENGHDVNFSSKYSLSNITDVEKVSVN